MYIRDKEISMADGMLGAMINEVEEVIEELAAGQEQALEDYLQQHGAEGIANTLGVIVGTYFEDMLEHFQDEYQVPASDLSKVVSAFNDGIQDTLG